MESIETKLERLEVTLNSLSKTVDIVGSTSHTSPAPVKAESSESINGINITRLPARDLDCSYSNSWSAKNKKKRCDCLPRRWKMYITLDTLTKYLVQKIGT